MRFQNFSSRVIRRPEDTQERRKRIKIISLWGICGFLIILVALWQRQVIHGEKFKELSEKNHIRLVPMRACRGNICDRKGIVLADNQPLFKIVVIPQELQNINETVETLSRLLCIDKEKTIKKINRSFFNPFSPLTVKSEVDMRTITMIEERRSDLPGVFVLAEPRRNYPFGKLAAHLIGYLGRQKEEDDNNRYLKNELVGKIGIERSFQTYLRGENGGQEILINSRGEQLGILSHRETSPGYKLILTIDKELQEAAEKSLEGKGGAMVVLDPRNGDVLALVGSPAFDPNIFTKYLSPEKYKEISTHPGRPFYNRAISGLYPPASTFKIIVSLAALEEGILKPETTLPGEDNEPLNIVEALTYSSDPFFYKTGEMVGVDTIARFARRAGLGTKTGIPLPYERKGFIPDRKWRTKWHKGEIHNLSIGQGAVQVTPLQMANLIAAIANRGKIYRPRIVKKIISPEGETIKTIPVKLQRELRVSQTNLDLVRKGLRDVVNKEGKRGTGWRARMKTVKVAGKTGTAESTNRKFQPGAVVPYKYRDHAWFVAFAPFDNPEIALAVLVEHGGWGGSAAAPLAKEVLEVFFRKDNDND